MAGTNGPDESGGAGSDDSARRHGPGDDLERRRADLEASLAARKHGDDRQIDSARSAGTTGYGQAIKLSSEFIAGVAVGAGLGWIVDRFAGTSPFGLIVFLLLGFGAGVLNVMRSAGVVAEAGIRREKPGD